MFSVVQSGYTVSKMYDLNKMTTYCGSQKRQPVRISSHAENNNTQHDIIHTRLQ